MPGLWPLPWESGLEKLETPLNVANLAITLSTPLFFLFLMCLSSFLYFTSFLVQKKFSLPPRLHPKRALGLGLSLKVVKYMYFLKPLPSFWTLED